MSWLTALWRRTLSALAGPTPTALPPDADAFLRGILDDPDDYTARLVFADWLDEQGHAHRAEFIRLQCELDEMPDEDTRRPRLEARERTLLALHATDWGAGVNGLADGPLFRRGFVEGVRVAADRFGEVCPALCERVPLREAELYEPFEPDAERLAGLADCPSLARLRTLTLAGFTAHAPGLERLFASPHLTRLTVLGFRSTPLDGPALGALVASPAFARLAELRLPGCVNVTAGLGAGNRIAVRQLLVPALAGVRVLDLSDNRIEDGGLRNLADSEHVAGLRVLRLRRCGVGPDGVRAVLDSPHFSSLERIDLRDNELLAGYPSTRVRRAEVRRDLQARFGSRARLK